jgi:hypothetical protein
MTISVKQARQILNNYDAPDNEIQQMLNDFYILSEIIIDTPVYYNKEYDFDISYRINGTKKTIVWLLDWKEF